MAIDQETLRQLNSFIKKFRHLSLDAAGNLELAYLRNTQPQLFELLNNVRPNLPNPDYIKHSTVEDYGDRYITLIHPDLVKKIDPDFFEVRKGHDNLIKYLNDTQRAQGLIQSGPNSGLIATMRKGMRYFTPKLYKNMMKIPAENIVRAVTETHNFLHDNAYRFDDNTQYDSLGSIRRAIEQFQEKDEQTAHDREVSADMLSDANIDRYLIIEPDEYYAHPEEFEGIPDPSEDEARWDDFVYDLELGRYVTNQDLDEYYQRLVEEKKTVDTSPYKYSDDVKQSVDNGWRLFESPEDQGKVGCELGHCYGDTQRYGNSFKQQYTNRIRSGKSILITKGNVTAEIALDTDNKGTITNVDVTQIQGPNNSTVDPDNPLSEQVGSIAERLIGKNIRSLSPQEVEGEISDIICKHLIKTTPANRNVVSALHRRF